MRKPLSFVLTITILVGGFICESPSCRAQVDPVPGGLYRKIYPHPTGKDGMEDLVMAGDIVNANKLNSKVWNNYGEITLADRRRVLNQPDIVRALNILHRGLTKPIPVPSEGTEGENSRFEGLASMRALARLLMLQQYVYLADGRVSDAIFSMRDGLKLGCAMQSGSLIGGLVGIAIDAISLRTIGDHLGQLSARDCERLIALAQDWMRLEDPQIGVFKAEFAAIMRLLNKLRTDPTTASQMLLGDSNSDGNDGSEMQEELKQAIKDPVAWKAMMDQTAQRVTVQLDAVIANLRLPPWARKEIESPEAASLVDSLVAMMAPVFSQATEKFTRAQTLVQLLGVHAAIRRYRWEYDKLPDSLETLKLGSLITDPYTGQPLVYNKTSERTYDLYSQGPCIYDDEGKPIPDQRTPVTLTPNELKR